MIELLLPCGFDTLEYSWVEATIGICMLEDYSVAEKRQQHVCISTLLAWPIIFIEHANGLHHRRPIKTLIRLGSNPYGP
jgi:hypothetical protein